MSQSHSASFVSSQPANRLKTDWRNKAMTVCWVFLPVRHSSKSPAAISVKPRASSGSRQAKVADCRIHDLRRPFTVIAQRAGVDRHVVKNLGGWSSVVAVERHYTGDVAPAYRQAMDRIARTASA